MSALSVSDRLAFSVNESAILLGVSVDSVRAWVKTGKLGASRVGGKSKILIPRTELERLLESEKVQL
jgi:excisionase family DNA binding protein